MLNILQLNLHCMYMYVCLLMLPSCSLTTGFRLKHNSIHIKTTVATGLIFLTSQENLMNRHSIFALQRWKFNFQQQHGYISIPEDITCPYNLTIPDAASRREHQDHRGRLWEQGVQVTPNNWATSMISSIITTPFPPSIFVSPQYFDNLRQWWSRS